MIDTSGLIFPKPKKTKKRKSHPESIMHRKEDGTCYLCMLLDGEYRQQGGLEEHHVFYSKHQRALSEEYGLKVYLCRRKHHREGPVAVHNNREIRRMLEAAGQQAFEERYGNRKFVEVFGANYMDEETEAAGCI